MEKHISSNLWSWMDRTKHLPLKIVGIYTWWEHQMLFLVMVVHMLPHSWTILTYMVHAVVLAPSQTILTNNSQNPVVCPTFTCRCTPRPHSCSLTSASIDSYQVVACITTVGCCLSKSCSSSVTSSAIGWVIQSATVHNCHKEESSSYVTWYFNLSWCILHVCYIGIDGSCFKPRAITFLTYQVVQCVLQIEARGGCAWQRRGAAHPRMCRFPALYVWLQSCTPGNDLVPRPHLAHMRRRDLVSQVQILWLTEAFKPCNC